MMLRKLKSISKLGLALVLIIGSTVLFGIWWRYFKPQDSEAENRPRRSRIEVAPEIAKEESKASPAPVMPDQNAKAVQEIKEHLGSLFLADGDLMEMETGKLLKSNWLGGAKPLAIYFHEESGKFIGRFERGFARYAIDGQLEKELSKPFGVKISDDLKTAVYAEGGNIWTAGIDWNAFEFTQPKQITTVGSFQDAFVLQNVLMMGKGGMIISIQNQQVRVNLHTGAVTQLTLPMNQVEKRRSPGGNHMVGDKQSSTGTTLYVYDVETDNVKTLDLGRARLTDSIWLSNDVCCLLIESQAVMKYDHKSSSFTEVMKLPSAIERIAGPSETGRFVFGSNQSKVMILDLEKKTTIPVNFPPQNVSWIAQSTLLMARDITDSQYRGTWAQPLDGGEAVRVATEPYSFTQNGATVLPVKEKHLVIFGTQTGLLRMKHDGSEAKMIISLLTPIAKLQAVMLLKD